MKTRKYSTVTLLLFIFFTAVPVATHAQSANLAFVRGTATSVGNIQFSSILDSVTITGDLTAPGRISNGLSIPANRIQYDVINGNQGTMSSWTVYYSSSVGPEIIGACTPLGYVTSSGKRVSQGGVAYGTVFNAGYGIYNYNTKSPWSIDYEPDHITFNGMADPQAGLGMNDGAGFVKPTPYLPSFAISFSTNLSCGLVTASAMIDASNLTGQVYGPVPNTGLPSATPGAIGGVGLQIEKTNSVLLVTHVIVAGPAERAGLQVDSKIISIDGMPTSDMTVNDAAKLLRGGVGTTVKISVLLPDGTSHALSLTRANIGALMHPR